MTNFTMISVGYITNAAPDSGVGHRAQQIRAVLQEQHAQACQITTFSINGRNRTLVRDGKLLAQLRRWPGILNAKTVSWTRLGRLLHRQQQRETTTSLWHATNQSLSFCLDARQPSVVTVHDLIELLEPQTRLGSLAARYLYRGIKAASHCIAVSEYTARSLEQVLHIPREKITVIHNGAAREFYPINNFTQSLACHTLQQELKLNATHKVILYVGSEHPRKNLVGALEASARVMEKNPAVVFIKVGKPGLASGRLEFLQTIEAHKLRGRVRILGNVSLERLNELYNIADVFLYPSRFEGFGLPPLQALAAGTPVITSNTTSLPEVVGDAALQHNPDDMAAFTQSIEKLLSDTNEAVRLSALGVARAKQFTWERAAAAELEVYKRVIRNNLK